MESIPRRLLYLREASGFARKRFAELVGLSASHPKLLETGTIVDPSMPVLRRIAETTGASLEWVVFGIGETPNPDAVKARCESLEAERKAAPESDAVETDDIATADTLPPTEAA